MTSEPDYYTVLGLTPRADLPAIRDQYRRLAKVFHPDRNDDDPWCQEQLKRINLAYEILADPSRKAAYDVRYRPAPPTPVSARTSAPARTPSAPPPAKARPGASPATARRGRRALSAVSLIVLSACVALLLLGVGVLQAMDPAVLSAFWAPGTPGHIVQQDNTGDAPQGDTAYYTVPVGIVPPAAGDPNGMTAPVLPADSPAAVAPAAPAPHANPFVSRLSDASSPAPSPAAP